MSPVPQLVAALFLLCAIVIAWLRARVIRIETVIVAVQHPWALDQQCRAIRQLVAEAPDIKMVEFHLGDFFVPDASSIALLMSTRDRLLDSRVRLSISAPAAVGSTLMIRGLPVVLRDATTRTPPQASMPN